VACIWKRFLFVIWHFVLLWFRFLLHSCGCRSFNRWSFRSFLLNTLLATAKQLAHYSLPDVCTTNQCRKETNQGHLLPIFPARGPKQCVVRILTGKVDRIIKHGVQSRWSLEEEMPG
jgi:hypothetical protein